MDADKWTDKELARLEKRIREQYTRAQQELDKKAKAYFAQYAERFKKEELVYKTSFLPKEKIAEEYAKIYTSGNFENWYAQNKGKYTKQKFDAWKKSQIGRGKHWERLRDQMAARIVEADKIAAGYINGILPGVYANNSNQIASIAQAAAMDQGVLGISFEQVSERTVRNMMKSSSSVRPYKPVDIELVGAAQWSKNLLQDELLQGILQGDSIDHIADRFQQAVNMERAAAVRNARTAVTAAQNKAKQDRFEELEEMGATVYKVWSASIDDRVRDEHAEADGQEVPIDEPFEVGGEEMMFPGDSSLGASGWNLYNCRCAMHTGKIVFHSKLSDSKRAAAKIEVE